MGEMNKTYLLIAGAVLVLLVAGGVFAFRGEIKKMVSPATEEVQKEIVNTEENGEENKQMKNQTPPPGAEVPEATEEGAVAKEVVVELTDSGYSPATITIKKGTTVKFVNKTSRSSSTATDPHPEHTDYPGFDQYKTDQRGKKEFVFTFEKLGTWSYHNHLRPQDTGKVIVTE